MWIGVYPDLTRDGEPIRFVCLPTRTHFLTSRGEVWLLDRNGTDLAVRRQSLEYFLNPILQ